MNTYELARRFSAKVRETLTAEQLAECIALNAAEQNENICHTHDYCDANELMLSAWHDIEPGFNLLRITHNEKNAARWTIAWDTAKTADFDDQAIVDAAHEIGIYFERMQAE
jgi:phosphohistidine phosphatase SixA